jgi:DNA processing protein
MATTVEADTAVWWLRLAALNLSARRKTRLLQAFGSPAGLFAAGPEAWRAAGLDEGLQALLRRGARLDVRRDQERAVELGVELIARDDARYPPLLAVIDDPPPMLFVRGRLPEAGVPCVALVGTRRASPYGELVAEDLAKGLGEAGVAVISGLAAGIDTSAHHGALRVGGATVGVLGCGVDVVYPKVNAALAERMAAEGALVSEFPLGTQPRGWHFPTRNRVISGMSKALVVVQAPKDSGALITARLAMEQNREVLAVPGSITDTRQAGCHALIRDGAVLVRGVDDILEVLNLERLSGEAADGGSAPELGTARPVAPARPLPPLTESEAAVAGALGLVPQAIDDVIEQTGLATPEVQSALVTLELKQVVRRLPGNRFVRAT